MKIRLGSMMVMSRSIKTYRYVHDLGCEARGWRVLFGSYPVECSCSPLRKGRVEAIFGQNTLHTDRLLVPQKKKFPTHIVARIT